MAAIHLLLLGIICLGATAIPQDQRKVKNTIFLDEQLEGEIFENLRKFDDVAATDIVVTNVYRLPTTTKPKHYNIAWTIDTDPNVLAFSGIVEIYLYATQANVSNIVIHSNELNIISVNLTKDSVQLQQTHYLQPEYHFLHVQLVNDYLNYNANDNEAELYVLSIEFEAELRHDMYGIYRSWFRNNYTEEVSYMASTQFQSTAARSAFPCYDEPSFKAEFNITITHRRDVKSWSCTRILTTRNSTTSEDFEDDVYHTTPVMSTYLLALIVADYESNYTLNADEEIMHEVIARRGAMVDFQYEYAQDMGQALLNRMNIHTDLDFYSVNSNLKMTQAAIPDFGAGAMENWGLLTYREAYLMYKEGQSNSNYKQLIAYILSHEIAHMWFGNLVTCDWWDVLWLNEGFARYYQYFLTHWVDPSLGLGVRFINEQVHTALLADSTASAHPLSHSGVGSPGAVSSMFSTLSYNKGAAVIRMTEKLLGFVIHERGLRAYLQNRRLQTALPIDLFEALQEVAVEYGAIDEYGPDFSVIDYYKSWTEQAGHPVLNVEINRQTGVMTILQRRFDINTGYGTSANWIVPISYATESNPDFVNTKPTHIITEALSFIEIGDIGNQWVILNKQQEGYYRVNYDDYTWDRIALALRGPQRELIHEYNRAQIVNDVFQFARAGLMTYTRALDILSFLQYETAYTPWVAAMTGFTWLRGRFASSEYLDELHELIEDWATTVMNQLGYYEPDGEEFMTSYLRMQIAPIMCIMGVPACREAARTYFDRQLNGEQEVPVDSRTWVYCNALRNGTEEDFNYLWDRFQTHNVYSEKILLLGVLGCTPHENSLRTYLDGILEDTYIVRRQDYNTAFSSAVNGNENNTQIVFRYVRENLEKVEAAYNVTSSLASPLSTISARLRTEEEIAEFELWAQQNRNALGSAYNSIYNGAQSARQALEWLEENELDVANYLEHADEIAITTTEEPITTTTPVVTVTPPSLVAPVTPDLPDSAVTTILSLAVIALAAIVNLAL